MKGAHERFAWIAFAVALVVLPALLWRYVGANSATFDEGEHIAAGYRYWQCGDYGVNPEHPPLAKLIAAAPVRHWQLGELSTRCGTGDLDNMQLLSDGYRLMHGPYAEELLRTARTALLIVPLALLVIVFFATRAWFGPLAAGWAVLLTLFDPNLTAHGALVTTDVSVTAATLLSVFCAWRFCQKPGVARTLWLGLAMGLALATKHSGVLVPPIVLLECVAYGLGEREGRGRYLRKLAGGWAAACLVGVVLLWSTYQFRFAALPYGHGAGLDVAATVEHDGMARTPLGAAVVFLANHRILPESYLFGLVYVLHNTTKTTYLFGQELARAVWYYFPAVLVIKTPLTILILLCAGLAAPGFWKRYARVCVFLGLAMVVFLGSAMSSGIGLGIRHILPAYVFLVVLAAGAAAWLCGRFRWGAAACTALVAFGMVSYSGAFPNELAYANEAWGGPNRLRFYLGDSNLDWGQSLYLVRDWVARRPAGPCWIAWFGMQPPQQAGIPCQSLAGPAFLEAGGSAPPPPIPERFGGTVLISASLLDNDLYPYRWFRSRRPDAVIAAGVLVFHGEFDRPEIAAERRMARGWWFLLHDQPGPAIPELAAAAPHANSRSVLHALWGWAQAARSAKKP
jgi:hypothetical protein